MPPTKQRNRGGPADCFPPFYNASAAVIDHSNLTSQAAETNTHEDMQALMYIVCVLLFYSLGIVVGIITYLKREKQEIEESKMFDEFVTIINERQPINRLIKVQEVIQRLEQLQGSKALPQLECADEIYSAGKNSYTSVLSPPPPPLGVPSSTYGVYETLNNENILTMDITPKTDVNESRHEEGYISDSDPFQNKRLSQVVAQILDSNPDIGAEDVFDDVDGVYYEEDDSLCTDFINYKEEPKNKELFRTQCKEIEEWDSERTPKSVFSSKESEWPQPPKLAKDSVSDTTALLESEESSTCSPTTTTFDRDDVDRDVVSDVSSTGFRWSVTSV